MCVGTAGREGDKGFQRRLVNGALRKTQGEHLAPGVGLAGWAELLQAVMV